MNSNQYENIVLLYVEDDENIRSVYERYLSRKIKKIIVATNGQDGYEKYLKYEPDLIITDIKMPIMSGLEMSKLIRDRSDEIPIVVTTAHTETEFFQEAISIGVNAFLLKPVDMKKLNKTIDEFCENLILKIKNQESQKIIIEQNKMVALADLISNIAHQWRQPLAAISAASFNMQFQIDSGKYDAEVFSKKIENIGECVQYLSTTIDSFRNMINDDLKTENFDVAEKIKECLSIESGIITGNNIDLVINLDDNIIVNGYPNEFVQALINIINNSIDSFEKKANNDKIIIVETIVNDNITILIKDSGNGIDDEVINSMFEPYATTKHKSRGVGLGLHMAYEIITEKMRGTIQGQNCKFEHNGVSYSGTCIQIALNRAE